jgi:hypothetical protein
MPIIPPLESLRQEEWSIFSLKKEGSWVWWLMPVILVTQEVEIRRMEVPSLPWQKVCKTPSQLIKSWAQWCAPVIPTTWEA